MDASIVTVVAAAEVVCFCQGGMANWRRVQGKSGASSLRLPGQGPTGKGREEADFTPPGAFGMPAPSSGALGAAASGGKRDSGTVRSSGPKVLSRWPSLIRRDNSALSRIVLAVRIAVGLRQRRSPPDAPTGSAANPEGFLVSVIASHAHLARG
jgi:hypothetical protein